MRLCCQEQQRGIDMVWARSKLLIWDYLFLPVKTIRITYAGKTPEKFYLKIQELLKFVFDIPDSYVQERDYTWEKLADMDRFEIRWDAYKVLDVFSSVIAEVELKGFTANGEGKVAITIRNARLITEYPQDTLWQKSFPYEFLRRFWHRLFYHHKRMEYINMGKEIVVRFEQSLKQFGEAMNGD